MKKLVLLSLAIGLSFLSMAQAPQLINYQAIIRNATGQVVQNQNVSLRLSIHEKYSVGINVYQEEHMVTTNDFGLVNIHIGEGVNKIGLLNGVKWGNDVHVLKVSLDQNGGSSFSVMGYAQLVSVPYALYAANVSYADTSATNELQMLSFANDTLRLSNGNSIYLPNTDYSKNISGLNDSIMVINSKLVSVTQQVKNDSIYLSGLINSHIQNDADIDSTNEIQNLSLAGNILNISGGNSVTLPSGGTVSNDNDSTNEIQSLSRNLDTLFISESNYIVLPSGSINTDDQNLNISGDTLYIEDGTPVVLTKYLNTDGQSLSLSGNNLSISGGNSVTLPSGGAVNNDNDSTNEIQALSMSGDTIYLSNGGFVKLPAATSGFDGDSSSTNEIQALTMSGDTIYLSNGGFVKLPAATSGFDGDSSSTNEIQALTMSGDTIYLSNGGFVKLPAATSGFDGDSSSTNELVSSFVLSNDTLSITDASGIKKVGLGTYMDNTDAQALSMSGDTIYLSNGGFVKLPAATSGFDGDSSSTNELQALSLSGNNLTISNGNTVALPASATSNDNDSTNELNSLVQFVGSTLTITDGGGAKSANLSSLLDNTDSQALSVSGSTLSISGGNSVTLPAGGGPNNDNDSTNELQFLTLSSDTLKLSNGGSVILPSGTVNTDDQNLSLSGDTLYIEDGSAVNLSSYKDNTDSQSLSLSGSTLTISGGNAVTLPSGGAVNNDNDSTNEYNSSMALSGSTLSVTDGGGAKSVNVSSLLDNTDSQSLSVSGSTLTITGGNSVTLPSGTTSNDNDSTNELNSAFAINSNNLTVTDAGGAKTVSLAPYLDNTDAQTLSLSGNTLSITGGNNVTLPGGSTYTTKGIDSVLTAGNNAAGLDMVNVGKLAIGTATADSTLTVSGGINANNIRLSNGAGANKVLTSDASGNASWVSPATVAAPTEIKDADNDTKIQVEESTDEDIIRFDIAGNERWRMEGTRIEPVGTGGSVFIGDNAGQSDDLSSNNNTFIGNNSGQTNTTGSNNSAIGYNSLSFNTSGTENASLGQNSMYNNTTGYRNAVMGVQALFTNTTGLGNVAMGYRALRTSSNKHYNVGIGYDALYNNNGTGNIGMGFYALRGNVSGNYNSAIGYRALGSNASGQRNIAFGFYSALDMLTGSYNITIGDYALNNNINGSNNVVVGRNAGYTNLTGSRNVFIGYQAGYSESGTDKLYIDASTSAASSTSPLIYGDFAADELKVNGDLEVRDDFILPTGASTGKILTSDASGKASWSNPGAVSLGDTTQVSDLDGDTKIQMEESSDEDIIRFDLAGNEQWVMKGARLENNNSGLSTFIGQGAGEKDDLSNNRNSFVGYYAGQNTVTGAYNSAFGAEALRNNTSNFNTAVGSNALNRNTSGQQNTAVGSNALRNNLTGDYNSAYGVNVLISNSTGNFNTASGYYSMGSSVTGSSNTATGSFSLRLNSTGYSNSAHGYAALYFNSTGYQNTSSGVYSLYRNTTGYLNTAMGYGALQNVRTGYHNSGVGGSAGYTMQTGYQNSIIGYQAMYRTTTGNNNAALGYRAGFYNQAGYQNTYVGSNAGPAANSGYFNSMALGYNTSVVANNQVRVGNSSITSIGGQVGWTTVSDGRFKENLKSNVAGLSFIMELKPVTYNLNAESLRNKLENKDSVFVSDSERESMINKFNFIQSGFVAQDVEKAAKKVGYSFSGVDAPKNDNDIYGLRYSEFVVPLVKGMQEQQEMIEAQQELIKKLEKRITALEK